MENKRLSGRVTIPTDMDVVPETLALLLSAACLVGKRKKYGYA